jgi:hypothetical protein
MLTIDHYLLICRCGQCWTELLFGREAFSKSRHSERSRRQNDGKQRGLSGSWVSRLRSLELTLRLVPIIGDVGLAAWKANSRNAHLYAARQCLRTQLIMQPGGILDDSSAGISRVARSGSIKSRRRGWRITRRRQAGLCARSRDGWNCACCCRWCRRPSQGQWLRTVCSRQEKIAKRRPRLYVVLGEVEDT